MPDTRPVIRHHKSSRVLHISVIWPSLMMFTCPRSCYLPHPAPLTLHPAPRTPLLVPNGMMACLLLYICTIILGLRLLFFVLSTRAGALILTGRAVPFYAQSLAARHAVLKRWSVSRIGKFREAFQVREGKRSKFSVYANPTGEDIPKEDFLPRTADADADVQGTYVVSADCWPSA